jgi:hypothetical protein
VGAIQSIAHFPTPYSMKKDRDHGKTCMMGLEMNEHGRKDAIVNHGEEDRNGSSPIPCWLGTSGTLEAELSAGWHGTCYDFGQASIS